MTKLYGLLHDASTGDEIVRSTRVLKVGFGIPKDSDVHVWIDLQKKWCVQGGLARKSGVLDIQRFDKRQDAQICYIGLRKEFADLVKKAKKEADVVKSFPRKIPYWTFLRMGMDGEYVHDFDAIEAHGPLPNEIDIVFLTDEPLDYCYSWYAGARLNCRGDGKVAKRRVDAARPDDKAAAEAAAKAGQRFFQPEHCYVADCQIGKAKQCKPHGRLFFQLVNQPRFGGTVTYDTTGFRSVSQLYSCIRELKSVTGHGEPERGYIAGIPLKLVMRPYKVTHEGKPSVQFAVSLEYRAQSAVELRRMLIAQGQEFRQAAQIVDDNHRLAAPATPSDGTIPEDAPLEDADGRYMDVEFGVDDEGPDYENESQDPAPAAAAAQEGK